MSNAPADLAPRDDEFKLLIDSIRDYAIFLLDPNGVVRSWNEGARLLKGYSASDIVGRSFATFYTDEAKAAGVPERLLAEALKKGRVEDVGWRVRKDGSRFWASVLITALVDNSGKHAGFAKVTRDLTDASFRRFVEAANTIVWTTDANGKPSGDSESWRAFTGQSVADWLGRHAYDSVHEDDVAALRTAWDTAKVEARALTAEFRLRRRDGVYVWMHAHAVPLLDAGGKVREWFGVTSDISARKAAEHEAERQTKWWTTTLTSIGDGVVATDKDGNVRFLNPIAERLMALTNEEARGRPLASVFRIVNEDTREPVPNPVDRVRETGRVVELANHTVLINNKGVEIPIDDSAAPIRTSEGELDGVVLVFRDVTAEKIARKKREFLVRVSDEMLRAPTHEAALATLARLTVPRLADWCAVELREPGTTTSKQIAVAHVDPKKVELAKMLNERYPPDPHAKAGVPEVIRTGKAELYREIPPEELERGARDEEHLRVIRELRLQSAVIVPLKTDDGVIGAITLVHAESGRRYDEDDVAFAEDLAGRAALVLARLQAESDALAADRTKDEFLATISHELRTPLQAILGYAAMLKRGNARDPQKAIDAIVRNAETQARLIEDILDVSRIITGKLVLSLKELPLASVVNAAMDVVRPAAHAKRVDLVAEVPPSVGVVEADSDRLQQVVWNLLTNAIKFTDPGGRVTVRASREGSWVRLEVKDTGRGIPREHLHAIFERFRQVDTGTTRGHGGLGLGLAIVRHLVEAHGGAVEAHSDGIGAGATFVVSLPAHQPVAPAFARTPQPSPRAQQPLDGAHVLIVDDDADSRDIVAEVLESAGAAVAKASSAQEALRAFQKNAPDILVSDIGMPGEDGFSLITRIRALPADRGGSVKAVALTAFARSEDVERAMRAGFDRHLAKPVDPDALVETLRRLRTPS